SSTFDRFGYSLFRNAYRVRGDDLFDVTFVQESKALRDLRTRVTNVTRQHLDLQDMEPYASVLKGNIPGEGVLVRRMLWEIIDKIHYADHIDTDHIIYFRSQPNAPDKSGVQIGYLDETLKNIPKDQDAVALTFRDSESALGSTFTPSTATVTYDNVS